MTDHDDLAPGGPALERQERPQRLDVQGRPLVPSRVPEEQPTPLRDTFIYLSLVALVCGVIAIMALELGTPFSSWLVQACPSSSAVRCLLAVTAGRDRAHLAFGARLAAGPSAARARFRMVWLVVLVMAAVAIVAVMAAALVA